MSTFKSFEDIFAWQKAREIAIEIFAITNDKAFTREFGLKDQMRRSSGSIMDNVAEGFEEGATKNSFNS